MNIQPPQPDEVRGLRERHTLKQAEFASLLHSSVRTVQHWEATAGTPEHRKMPLASWELALLKLGEMDLDGEAITPKPKVKRQRNRPAGAKVAKKLAAKLPVVAKAPPSEIERLRALAKAKLD